MSCPLQAQGLRSRSAAQGSPFVIPKRSAGKSIRHPEAQRREVHSSSRSAAQGYPFDSQDILISSTILAISELSLEYALGNHLKGPENWSLSSLLLETSVFLKKSLSLDGEGKEFPQGDLYELLYNTITDIFRKAYNTAYPQPRLAKNRKTRHNSRSD